MIGLDTNVVVRYLTRDDETQWQKAVDLINQSESCFLCNVVLCEIFWVLKGKPYRYSQTEIMETLELMLQSPKFDFENRSIAYQAIAATKQGKADFADYLIGTVNHHHGATHTVTFDRKLKNVKRFTVLD
ncbi:putative nucleic-acid-binding protein [Xenococcus sp. PCC 7305]|uniref:PIN domain-containing protein n=1 Tax=Xenococcus sp. PCC 7305 TaxID=102125 RepID=UPI0002AC5A8B|nr:type II toxin-antitoxin system VapC family toxin [Xenococcus sp. PCC 7305]ELS05202.1 putative nucleic-acid-binding protein [Xenococcus sp. PCC 7305]